MKFAIIGLALVVSAGCGKFGIQPPAVNPGGPTCGAGVREVALCAVDPTLIKFKSPTGHETVSWHDVSALDVKIFKPAGSTVHGHEIDLERTFTGSDALKVLSQFQLHAPTEGGVPASTTTGEITLVYIRKGDMHVQNRVLTIENSRMIEDSQYRGVTYAPQRSLDRQWLARQPEN